MSSDGTQLHPFEQQLHSQLQELIFAHRPGQKFCVALSGGADSTALLVAARRVVGAANVRALHGNHSLHPQAPEWVEHCEHLCEQL